MAVIDLNSPVVGEDSCTFWNDELTNKKILLLEVQKGILHVAGSNHKSYKIDTGQSMQSKENLSLEDLTKLSTVTMSQIQDLELKLGIGKPGTIIVQPCF